MAVYGIRGTGSWVTDQRPTSYREAILRLYPNGKAPLTALMSKMKTEVVNDPQFNWWTKAFSAQAGAVTGVYTDSALTVAYVSGGVAGDYVFVKAAEATISEFRVGHQVILRDSSDLTTDVVGKVTERVDAGASSYVKVKLLEADDNSTTHDISDVDRILVSGNINPENGAMPDAISYDVSKWYNYTQIFRTPLEISGTMLETKLRTNPGAYEELKREALEMHSVEMEKAFWTGVPSEGTGANGLPERTTLGIIPAIRGGYTGHNGTAGTVSDYVTASAYAGQTWLAGGKTWLETNLEVMFRYGNTQKLAFCGSGALMAINQLVENFGDFSYGPTTNVYGIDIMSWKTPLGTIGLLTHPLFSLEPTTRYTMAIIEPENLIYRPLTNRDTKFISDGMGTQNSGYTRRDGKKEEYLTEAGLEYHHPISWGYLTGFGQLNTAS